MFHDPRQDSDEGEVLNGSLWPISIDDIERSRYPQRSRDACYTGDGSINGGIDSDGYGNLNPLIGS